MPLKAKAAIITLLLAGGLLFLGMELGRLRGEAQVQEARALTDQATEKVLALTQQNQALEEALQQARLGGAAFNRPGEVWPQSGGLCGLLRLGQPTLFNQELKLELRSVSADQALVALAFRGERFNLSLREGQALPVADKLQISLQYLGADWAVVFLHKAQ